MRAAFAALGLGGWVDELPGGLDAPVGERGGNLSVGERQLVALARAQLGDPGLLILDEATSSVDPETEQALTEALDRLAAGRTVVSIAHRLSTAERADLVVVVDAGEIVERGTHDELVGAGGVYGGLYESWLGNTRSRPRRRRRRSRRASSYPDRHGLDRRHPAARRARPRAGHPLHGAARRHGARHRGQRRGHRPPRRRRSRSAPSWLGPPPASSPTSGPTPAATLLWRAGWAWVAAEGTVELVGPDDDRLDAAPGERCPRCCASIYTAAGGGEHEDWAEYDRVMAAERRVAVLLTPQPDLRQPVAAASAQARSRSSPGTSARSRSPASVSRWPAPSHTTSSAGPPASWHTTWLAIDAAAARPGRRGRPAAAPSAHRPPRSRPTAWRR